MIYVSPPPSTGFITTDIVNNYAVDVVNFVNNNNLQYQIGLVQGLKSQKQKATGCVRPC
jgi:hypothetical protein